MWIFSAFLWQLMRFNILQLLRNLRNFSHGKEISDADILKWANVTVKSSGRTSRMESFKDKSLSNGLFFLELLSACEPRVVNWNLATKGENDEEKRLNATYIISVARKLGCSIFLLPEDIMEVNQKMILTLTASIMYWKLQQPVEDSQLSKEVETIDEGVPNGKESVPVEDVSNLSVDDVVKNEEAETLEILSVNGAVKNEEYGSVDYVVTLSVDEMVKNDEVGNMEDASSISIDDAVIGEDACTMEDISNSSDVCSNSSQIVDIQAADKE